MSAQPQPKRIQEVLRRFPLAVSVVTVGRGGAENALTVSWASPVSFDPPHLMIAVDRLHHSISFLRSTKNFALNLLRAEDRRLAGQLARQSMLGEDKLEGLRTHEATTGAAIFESALAWFDCELVNTLEIGDHIAFVGRVVDAGVGADGPPLLTTDAGIAYLKSRP